MKALRTYRKEGFPARSLLSVQADWPKLYHKLFEVGYGVKDLPLRELLDAGVDFTSVDEKIKWKNQIHPDFTRLWNYGYSATDLKKAGVELKTFVLWERDAHNMQMTSDGAWVKYDQKSTLRFDGKSYSHGRRSSVKELKDAGFELLKER